jgi:hypothetical protein
MSFRKRVRAGLEEANLLAPEGLVTQKGADQGWASGAEPGSGGAGSAVMNHRPHLWKKPVVWCTFDHEDLVG